jgi:hypothetical protein
VCEQESYKANIQQKRSLVNFSKVRYIFTATLSTASFSNYVPKVYNYKNTTAKYFGWNAMSNF